MGRALFLLKRIEVASGWILVPLMLLYILTGFAMLGWFGMIDKNLALQLHIAFHLPITVLFALHAGICVFFWYRKKQLLNRAVRRAAWEYSKEE